MGPSLLVNAALVGALLFAAWLLARVAHWIGFPPSVMLVILGIVAASLNPQASQFELTPTTLGIFLPALVFEAAWDIDAKALRRVAPAIAVLAIPGVLLTAVCVAVAAVFGGGLAWPAALALGAIVSATDPVAVLALFRKLDMPVDLFTIVAGESIANDGVAAVLVGVLVPLARGVAAPSFFGAAGAMLYVALGGIAIGIVFALVVTPRLRRERHDWERIATTFLVAYGSYAAAALLGFSGIFASAAAGVALPALALAKRDAAVVEQFWDGTAELTNGLVFLLVGLNLRVDRIAHEPGLVLAVLAATVVSRAFLAYGLIPLASAAGSRSRGAIALAGVRGGLSLALALGLPGDIVGRPLIIDAVFAVVFVTLVVQGSTIAPLLRRLRPTSA